MPHRILIVDDNRIMRGMIARTVRMSGLAVAELREAAGGKAALAALAASPADLVLLDLNMPDLDGEQVLSAIRADPALAAVRVVVVSSDVQLPRRRRLAELGAELIGKPFRPEDLVSALGRLLAAAGSAP